MAVRAEHSGLLRPGRCAEPSVGALELWMRRFVGFRGGLTLGADAAAHQRSHLNAREKARIRKLPMGRWWTLRLTMVRGDHSRAGASV